MRITMTIAAVLSGISLLVAGDAMAKEWRTFNATAVVYDLKSRPQTSGKQFKSKVTSYNQGPVEVWELKNYIDGGSDFTARIMVVVSEVSVGSVVYDKDGKVVAEYGKGKKKGDGFYTFKEERGVNTVKASWYLTEDYIMSDFQLLDPEDRLLTRETVVYSSSSSRFH